MVRRYGLYLLLAVCLGWLRVRLLKTIQSEQGDFGTERRVVFVGHRQELIFHVGSSGRLARA